MDPLIVGAAFAVAQASVKTVKEAIKLGKDIYEVSGDLTKFFTSQSQINQEIRRAEGQKQELLKEDKKEDYYALTARALDAAIKAKKMKQDEAEIRTLLIWTGNGDVYDDMIRERMRLEKQQEIAESRELFERTVRAEKAQRAREIQGDIAMAFGLILLIGIPFFVIVQWGISQGLWTSGANDPRVVYQTQRVR
jgi:hypothetical protein